MKLNGLHILFQYPCFSSLLFDNNFKNAIGCIFRFDICKIAKVHVFSKYHQLGDNWFLV